MLIVSAVLGEWNGNSGIFFYGKLLPNSLESRLKIFVAEPRRIPPWRACGAQHLQRACRGHVGCSKQVNTMIGEYCDLPFLFPEPDRVSPKTKATPSKLLANNQLQTEPANRQFNLANGQTELANGHAKRQIEHADRQTERNH